MARLSLGPALIHLCPAEKAQS